MNKTEQLATINRIMSNGIRTSGKNEQGDVIIIYRLLNDVVIFNPSKQTVRLNNESEIKL